MVDGSSKKITRLALILNKDAHQCAITNWGHLLLWEAGYISFEDFC